MLRPLAAVMFVSLALLPPASRHARAAPIGVRASARLETTARFDNDTWSLVLSLTTDDGTPLALAPLTLLVTGLDPVALVTDATGTAIAPLPTTRLRSAGAAVDWTARFGGTHTAAPAEFSGRLDLARLPIRLSLASDATGFDLASPPAAFVIALATAEARPSPITAATVRFRIDNGPFQHARTDASGRLSVVIDPALVPAPTPTSDSLNVEAVFDGDAIHASAKTSMSIPRHVLSRITLRVAREGDAGVGRLRFSGRASHEFGAWAETPVRVMVGSPDGGETFAIPAITDARGIWNAAIPLERLRRAGLTRIAVTAHAAPARNVRPTETRPLLLEVPRIPGRSALVPIFVIAALLLGLRFADADARRALSRRIAAAASALVRIAGHFARLFVRAPRPLIAAPQGPAPGVTAASHGSRRRPSVISLEFRDHDTPSSLQVHVSFEWHGSDGTDDGGTASGVAHFSFENAGRGTCHLHVRGPGLVPVSLVVPMPHDGAWDGATVALRRIERRLRELHANLGRSLGVQTTWGRDTPRDLIREPSTATNNDRIPAFVDAVERAYFGPTPPTLADMERAESLLEKTSAATAHNPREAG